MWFDAKLVGTILPLAPGLIEALQIGADVLDLGCGQGHAVNLMAQAFPRSRFTGWDFSEEGIVAATAEASRLNLTNVRFAVRDLAALDAVDGYDVVTTFDVIRDLARPDEVLRRIAQAVRRDGTFLMGDIAASSDLARNREHPLGTFLYGASLFHCMTVSLAQGGPGLGTMWGEEKAQAMLAEAGFRRVQTKHLEGDVYHVVHIARKG